MGALVLLVIVGWLALLVYHWAVGEAAGYMIDREEGNCPPDPRKESVLSTLTGTRIDTDNDEWGETDDDG